MATKSVAQKPSTSENASQRQECDEVKVLKNSFITLILEFLGVLLVTPIVAYADFPKNVVGIALIAAIAVCVATRVLYREEFARLNSQKRAPSSIILCLQTTILLVLPYNFINALDGTYISPRLIYLALPIALPFAALMGISKMREARKLCKFEKFSFLASNLLLSFMFAFLSLSIFEILSVISNPYIMLSGALWIFPMLSLASVLPGIEILYASALRNKDEALEMDPR